MSDDDKKDSGLVGLAGGAAAGAAAGVITNNIQEGRLLKAAVAGEYGSATEHVTKNGLKAAADEIYGRTPAAPAAADAADTTPEKNPALKAKEALDDAETGVDKKALGKTARTTLEAELKPKNVSLWKNMTIKQKGTVAVAAVGTAVVGKMAFDAMFGKKKEGGHADRVESRREAEATAEAAR